MPDIFLSYSRGDQQIARHFARAFEDEGFSVWWDQSLAPGEAFDQVTERALEGALAVIVLWSKTSVNSRWVRAEATQANANSRLLPVMIEPCKRPIMFELVHTADLSGWRGDTGDAAWQSFVAGVRQFLRRVDGTAAAAMADDAVGRRSAPVAGITRLRASWHAAIAASWRLARSRVGLAIAAALAAAAVATTAGRAVLANRPAQAMPEVHRYVVEHEPTSGVAAVLALSPDASRLVFQHGQELWVRRLDLRVQAPIRGSAAAFAASFSPDNRSVAFLRYEAGAGPNPVRQNDQGPALYVYDFDRENLSKVATLEEAGGVTWGRQDWIYIGGTKGLWRVNARSGGQPELLAVSGEFARFGHPDALPAEDWVLLHAARNVLPNALGDLAAAKAADMSILALNVRTGKYQALVEHGAAPRYLSTGHLLFARGDALYAVAFDPRRLDTTRKPVTGEPVLVEQGVGIGFGHALYAVSANGTLAYPMASAAPVTNPAERVIVRVGLDGSQVKPLSPARRNWTNPRASPNDKYIAAEITGEDGGTRIWIFDRASGVPQQRTFEGERNFSPIWTDDSLEIIYTVKQGEDYALYRRNADGSGNARLVMKGFGEIVASDMHEGKLIYDDIGEGGSRDLFELELDNPGARRTLLATAATEAQASVSRDGAWIVYTANTTGQPRVLVRPYPGVSEGGFYAAPEGNTVRPRWSEDGRDIVYQTVNQASGSALWAVSVTTTPSFIWGTPKKLFDFKFRTPESVAERTIAAVYDLLPRGQGIVAVSLPDVPRAADAAGVVPILVTTYWSAEFGRSVPVK